MRLERPLGTRFFSRPLLAASDVPRIPLPRVLNRPPAFLFRGRYSQGVHLSPHPGFAPSTDGLAPHLCLRFRVGECRSGPNCPQWHVNPKHMDSLRQQLSVLIGLTQIWIEGACCNFPPSAHHLVGRSEDSGFFNLHFNSCNRPWSSSLVFVLNRSSVV